MPVMKKLETTSGTSAGLDPDDREALLRKIRQLANLLALLGVAFSILFAVGIWLLHLHPPPGAPAADLMEFYASESRMRPVLIGGIYVLPLAGVAFLWFMGLLRTWLHSRASRVSELFSTVQILAAAIFVALVLMAAGAGTAGIMSQSVGAGVVSVDAARLFPSFSRTLLLIFALRMAAIVVMTSAAVGHQALLFPRWFRVISTVIAVLLFITATLSEWLLLLFPVWVLMLAGLILNATRRLKASALPLNAD
jgi:hypothetical protein